MLTCSGPFFPSRGSTPRATRVLALASITVAAVVGTLVGTPSHASAASERDGGGVKRPTSTIHVNCQSSERGDGTTRRPLTSLAQVNARTLMPGTRVAFLRGTRCVGTLQPKGNGAEGSPVVITAYGEGTRPVIDGQGAPDTIRILNMSWVTLESLEVTNAAAPGSNRRGVAVDLENHGVGRGYVVRDLHVHDVWGDDQKDVSGSGGILFRVLGTVRPSWFEGVRVTDNVVEHLDRTGINVAASVWRDRPDIGVTQIAHAWTPSRDVQVSGNTVTDVGGDGIVLTNVDGGAVEHNRVHGFQLRSAGYNAGLWPWNSDNTAFRFNEASGGQTTRDGMGYDVDEGTNNTVVEYNYSHDNAGGFALICTASGTIRGAVIRYNISQNDRFRGLEMCSGTIAEARVHNNSIYVGNGIDQTVINENSTAPHNIRFDNNVVVKEGSGRATMNLRAGSAITLSHNVLVNVGGSPSNPGGSTQDPRFVGRGTGPDGYRLHESSLVLGLGTAIADNGGRDYFGAPRAGNRPGQPRSLRGRWPGRPGAATGRDGGAAAGDHHERRVRVRVARRMVLTERHRRG